MCLNETMRVHIYLNDVSENYKVFIMNINPGKEEIKMKAKKLRRILEFVK